ncbi:MAG: hypothetical protein WBO57_04650 [Gammaproteobacteria bacterium]
MSYQSLPRPSVIANWARFIEIALQYQPLDFGSGRPGHSRSIEKNATVDKAVINVGSVMDDNSMGY